MHLRYLAFANYLQFLLVFSSHHAVHRPLWYLGLELESYGLFLMGTIVPLYFSSSCRSISSTTVSLSARLVYSHGSSSILNRHGPSFRLHFAVWAGRGPHVTTAFFRVERVSERLRRCCGLCSMPGGGYQPSRLKPRR